MYWGERMVGARTRTRRAAKRNEMERFRISEIKKGTHAPHTKRKTAVWRSSFLHVEHTSPIFRKPLEEFRPYRYAIIGFSKK